MIPESIKSLFARTPVKKVVADELHQARLDLLNALAQSEYWTGRVKTLQRTVVRLEAYKVAEQPQ